MFTDNTASNSESVSFNVASAGGAGMLLSITNIVLPMVAVRILPVSIGLVIVLLLIGKKEALP